MRYTLPLLCFLNLLSAVDVNGRQGKWLYSIEVPPGWETISTPQEKLTDTREPLITWIKGGLEARLHSFPYRVSSIPPEAQVTRWLKKFSAEPLYEVRGASQGGFAGLILITESANEGFLGAAFSLGERGKRAFHQHPEVCSDWTFVVKGPAKELQQEKWNLLDWIETVQLPFEIVHD